MDFELDGWIYDINKLAEFEQKVKSQKWTFLKIVDSSIDKEYIQAILDFIICGIEYFHKDINDELIKLYLENSLKINQKYINKYKNSLNRLNKAIKADSIGDMVLDLSASLESVFCVSDELRLRLSLMAFYITKDKDIMKNIYDLYGYRNKYIHGNDIPNFNNNFSFRISENVFKLLQIPLQTGCYYNLEEINNNILNF
jgi:hypothetical protein